VENIAFDQIKASSQHSNPEETQRQRDFLATLLLQAVYESQGLTEHAVYVAKPDIDKITRARKWLKGPTAGLYLLTLDIRPQDALERLERKWERCDTQLHLEERIAC